MAATELARILYAVNKILEESSSKIGLSKRAAFALALIDMEQDLDVKGRLVMTNKGLRDKFMLHRISEVASAKKDASSAKSELLELNYIEVVGKVSIFGITPAGKAKAIELYDSMNLAIDGAGLMEDERALLRRLCGLRSFAESESATHRKAPSPVRTGGSKRISKVN